MNCALCGWSSQSATVVVVVAVLQLVADRILERHGTHP